jgi:hypothetical protein
MTEARGMHSLALSESNYREIRELCKLASAKLGILSNGEKKRRSYRTSSLKTGVTVSSVSFRRNWRLTLARALACAEREQVPRVSGTLQVRVG